MILHIQEIFLVVVPYWTRIGIIISSYLRFCSSKKFNMSRLVGLSPGWFHTFHFPWYIFWLNHLYRPYCFFWWGILVIPMTVGGAMSSWGENKCCGIMIGLFFVCIPCFLTLPAFASLLFLCYDMNGQTSILRILSYQKSLKSSLCVEACLLD